MSNQEKKSPPGLYPERGAPLRLIDIPQTKQPDFIEKILAEAGMPAELPDIGGRVRERKRKAALRKAIGEIPTAV